MSGTRSFASMSSQHDLKDGCRRRLVSLKVAELDPEQRLIECSVFCGSDLVLFIISNELFCFF